MLSAVHEHGVVHRLDQALEQLLAVLEPRAALLQIVEQLVDRSAQLPERCGLTLDPDAPAGRSASPRCFSCWENSSTARSWRRFQRNSTPTPTAAKLRSGTRERWETKSTMTSFAIPATLYVVPPFGGRVLRRGALREYRTGMA